MNSSASAGRLWVPISVLALSGCSDDAPAPSGGDDTVILGPLREAAAKAGKLLGAAVNADALAADPTYAELLATEFDYVTPENVTKWGPLEPTDDVYAWGAADDIVGFAEAHRQAVKGHAFVWHRQTPTWVSALSADELRGALKSHIETTLERYRGRVRAWDVVNEAVDVATASGYTESSVYWQKLGPGYIEDAFRWARAADPEVLLLYNEVGIERMGPKSDFTYALMRDLLASGVPIDGIGFQSHVSIHRYPSESNLRANIRRFAELGLRVNISELDARTLLLPGDHESRLHAQRIALQTVVGACVLEPACEAITLWGFTDRYSWINDEGEADHPLLFDRDYATKPAYQGVLDGLAGSLPTLGDNVVENGDFASGDGWSVASGELTIESASGRDGATACLSGQTAEGDGIVREPLLEQLAGGGPFAFSSFVRLRGVTSATVNATLDIEEEGGSVHELSLAVVNATDAEWTELSGYIGLGFAAPPARISMKIGGAGTGSELCVMDVALRPLSAP
jgi:GH35 family endo-1,4-beta-xylanase